MGFDLRRGPGGSAEINITPLIDVVLVLLIIFMVVTPLLSSVEVEVPRARPSPNTDRSVDVDVLSLDNTGRLFLGDEPVDVADLTRVLQAREQSRPGVPLRLKADARLAFQRVRQVLDSARESGTTTVALVVAERDP